MKAEIMTITPERAEELLQRNLKNRKFSRTYARKMAKDMAEGVWHETHQGIAIDKEGQVIDGQHRLAAIIESGVPQTLVVTSELEPDAYKYIDIGKRRSAADRLREDLKVADVASFIIRITDGTQNTSKIERLTAVRDQVRDTCLYFQESFPHKQRPFASAAARSAFVIAVDALGADLTYAQEQYDALCHYRFDDMSERSKNLVKRIAKGGFPAHSQEQRLELCYAVASCLIDENGKALTITKRRLLTFVRRIRKVYGTERRTRRQPFGKGQTERRRSMVI